MRGELTEAQRLRAVNTRLKRENHLLRERVQTLEIKVEEQARTIETLNLQLEELRQIVFGKKKPPQSPGAPGSELRRALPRPPRLSVSFRRAVPSAQEITSEQHYTVDSCPDCQHPLTRIKTIIRYQEDIVLPSRKTVVRQQIQTGFCQTCNQHCQAIPISAQLVTLGPNIKQAVSYWTYVTRLSFQQIIDLARDLYDLKLTDGEIAHILRQTAERLQLSYEQLQQDIRGSPVNHFDETGYPEQGGEGFAWIMTPAHGEEAVFMVGRNRGKGNAEELAGDFSGVRITDCYPAYDNLTGQHQVCWAHLLRAARDLADSSRLQANQRALCQDFYRQVACIYARLRQALKQPFVLLERTVVYEDLQKQLVATAGTAVVSVPKKLLNLKQRMHLYAHEFLTCLLYPDVPADNNKAERKLRHLVLKRKVSFGTKSKAGSHIFSVNASVLLSWWWSDRTNWFTRLSQALGT